MAEKQKLTKEERTKNFKNKTTFVRNAFQLFNKATEIAAEQVLGLVPGPDVKPILKKMLHSILFLGHNNMTCYSPGNIFADPDIFIRTNVDFPEPFTHFQTHVPLRTPFSYFLQLITTCYGTSDAAAVTQKRIFNKLLNDCKKSGDQYPLIPSVMCICENNKSRCYGVSLSCERDKESNIMIAVSCLHLWHEKVASAVMSVFPDGKGSPTCLKLPDDVTCEAYAVTNLDQVKAPCFTCNQLYSVNIPEHTENNNRPGNCAETEAISNLLTADGGVDRETTISRKVLSRKEIRNIIETRTSADVTNIVLNMDLYNPVS